MSTSGGIPILPGPWSAQPQASNVLASLLAVTLDSTILKKERDGEFALQMSQFPACNIILQRHKEFIQSGPRIDSPLELIESTGALKTEMFEPTPVNISENRVRVTEEWTIATADFAFEEREKIINRPPSEILNIVRLRRRQGYSKMAHTYEREFVGAPASSSDSKTAKGIKWWFPAADPGTAAGTHGHIATRSYYGSAWNGSGYTTTAGGNDRTSHALLKKYAYVYGGDINNGWIEGPMNTFYHETMLRAPMMVPSMKDQMLAPRKSIFACGLGVILALEAMVNQKGDGRSNDLMSLDEGPAFRKIPFIRFPEMDNDTIGSVVGLNLEKFIPVFMQGEFNRESDPIPGGVEQHRTIVLKIDSQYNFVDINPRYSGGRLHRAISA